MDVGVRDLKARLSEFLDRAARGEVITVTDRGDPKAVLGPLPGRSRVPAGIEEGWVTPATRVGLDSVRRHRATQRVLDVLADDRGE
ncbi:MAG TPA: type II toxin-antitoxin system prevent-host-death family antitoxin [Jiangellaceae bacterium]|jgi:prevent-host-death family protein|nr:type II toxin-antitoxin system prevent-host-death family antitoxin [Jiangellaceae bacterium]